MRGRSVLLGCALLLGAAPAALAHPERHAFFPAPERGPAQYPDSELLRTGRIAWLRPGQSVPFTVGWHAADRPVRIDYGVGSLPIPG